MKIFLAAGLCLVISMSVNASPNERVWSTVDSSGTERIIVLYWKESRLTADFFKIKPGKLQTHERSTTYKDWDSALDTLNTQYGLAHWSVIDPDAPINEVTHKVDTELANREIWKVKNQWDWSWEIKYADWVRATITPQFWKENGIATDCADVAFSARWIFARTHFLPMATSLSGSNVLFTQASMKSEWSGLSTHADWKKDKLFRAALNYVLNNSYTHSLLRDSYPIEITPDALLPGTHHLTLFGQTGHTRYFYKVLSPNEVPAYVTFSTVPREVRVLMSSMFDVTAAIPRKGGGILRMRWPVPNGSRWVLLQDKLMPHYSEEQYAPEFMTDQPSFFVAVFKRLDPDFSFEKVVQTGISDLLARWTDRMDVVTRGYEFCKINDCSPGSVGYEDWSTPTRDQRQQDTLNELYKFMGEVLRTAPHLDGIWRKALQEESLTVEGESYTLAELVYAWERRTFSSIPTDPPSVRWGLNPTTLLQRDRTLIQALLTKREEVILSQGAACRTLATCPPGSPEWERWQTFTSDEPLRALELELKGYCLIAPTKRCTDRTLPLNQERYGELTHQQWLDRSTLLNSSPLADLKQRRGEPHPSLLLEPLANRSQVIYSKQGYALKHEPNQVNAQLFDAALTRVIPLPGALAQMDPETSELYSYEALDDSNARFYFSYPETRTDWVQVDFPVTEPSTLTWTGVPGVVAVSARATVPENQPSLMRFIRKSDGLSRVFNLSRRASRLAKGIYLLDTPESESVQILDVSRPNLEPRLARWTTPPPNGFKATRLQLSLSREGRALLSQASQDPTPRREYFLLNLNTLEIEPLPKELASGQYNFNGFLDEDGSFFASSYASESGKSMLVDRASNGSYRFPLTYDQGAFVTTDPESRNLLVYLLGTQPESGTRLFHWENHKHSEILPPTGEIFSGLIKGVGAVTRAIDGNRQYLRSYLQNRLLLSGTYIYHFNETMHYVNVWQQLTGSQPTQGVSETYNISPSLPNLQAPVITGAFDAFNYFSSNLSDTPRLLPLAQTGLLRLDGTVIRFTLPSKALPDRTSTIEKLFWLQKR